MADKELLLQQAEQKVKERDQERERAKRDKLYLANEILGYTFQPDVHTELFSNYPTFDDSQPLTYQSDQKDRLILWSRGHYKSTSITVEIIQLILNFPNIRILIMRSTKAATQEWLGEILAHFTGEAEGSRLAELFPNFCGTKKQLKATATRFITQARTRGQLREATVTVASSGTNLTGKHFDVGMFDDLVTALNYQNQGQLTKVIKAFSSYVPLIEPGGYKYVTGTRYSVDDLYGEILRKDVEVNNWVKSIKNCWSDDGKEVRFPQVMVEGKSEPIGFTRELLLQIMHDDPEMFSYQYLNQPVVVSSILFTKDMLMQACISELDSPATSQTVLFVDTAAEGQRPDDSVIVAGRVDTLGRMYVVDIRGGQFPTAELANHVLDMTVKHRPLRVFFERTASCIHFVEFIRMVARDKNIFVPIDFIKVDNKLDAKNTRVGAVAGHIKQKRLFFYAGLPNWDKMMEQFTLFPKGRYGHDDYPDTVALMCQEFGRSYFPTQSIQSLRRHPLIAAMEDRGTDITRLVTEGYKPNGQDEMGDEFSY